MLEFADEISALEPSWASWAAAHEPRPIWLAALDLADGPRICGCFVTPARVALGLRAWDDADEGVSPAPYALFDIEKLVRMALHQSGLAFEALTSPRTWGELDSRRIASAAVTADILAYYRDVTEPLEAGNSDPWRWRTLLTGVLLATEGVISQDLPTLCARLGAARAPSPEAARPLRERLTSAHLPARPADYDFLNDLVTSARLDAS